MDFLITGRRYGKTTRAMSWLKEDPTRVLIVPTPARRIQLIREFELESHDAGRIFTSHQGYALRGRSSYEAAIEDVDWLLQELYGPVTLVTGTGTVRPFTYDPRPWSNNVPR